MDLVIGWAIKAAIAAAICAALWFAGVKIYHAVTDPFVQEGIQLQLSKDQPEMAASAAEIVALKAQVEKLTGEGAVLSATIGEMSAANIAEAKTTEEKLAASKVLADAAIARAAANKSRVAQLQAEAAGPPAPVKDSDEKLKRVGDLLRDALTERVRQ